MVLKIEKYNISLVEYICFINVLVLSIIDFGKMNILDFYKFYIGGLQGKVVWCNVNCIMVIPLCPVEISQINIGPELHMWILNLLFEMN